MNNGKLSYLSSAEQPQELEKFQSLPQKSINKCIQSFQKILEKKTRSLKVQQLKRLQLGLKEILLNIQSLQLEQLIKFGKFIQSSLKEITKMGESMKQQQFFFQILKSLKLFAKHIEKIRLMKEKRSIHSKQYHQSIHSYLNLEIQNLTQDNVSFENPAHLCCVRFFNYSSKISENEASKMLIILSLKEFQNSQILSRYICAGANQRNGAYLFVGLGPQNKIYGEKINQYEQKDKILEYFREAKKLLYPKGLKQENALEVSLDFVPVKHNGNYSPGIYVLRVNITPTNGTLFYLENRIYVYEAKNLKLLKGQEVYEKLQKRIHKKRVSFLHLRKNCQVPEIGEAIYFLPQFQYKHNGVLLQKQKTVKKLKKCLQQREIKNFTIRKKHEEVCEKNDQQIWLLSSQLTFQQMKEIIQNVYKKKDWKKYKYFEVKKNLLFQKNSQIIKESIKALEEELKKFDVQFEGEFKKKIILRFSSFEEAYFGYVALRRYRPFFKDNKGSNHEN